MPNSSLRQPRVHTTRHRQKNIATDPGFPVFQLDNDLRFTSCSESYLSLIGRDLNSVLGHLFENHHPNARGSGLLSVLKTSRCRELKSFTDYCHQLDCWMEFHFNWTPYGVSILVVDVTHRERAERNARLDADSANASLEGCMIGIAKVALDGRWLSMNRRCHEILKIEKLNDCVLLDLSLAKSRTADANYLAEMVSGRKRAIHSERQIIRNDGKVIWIQLNVALVRSENHQAKFFVIAVDEIGERKEVEKSLQFALEAAQMAEWDFDAINNVTRRSRRFDEIFGYSEPLPTWGYEDFLRHIHPDDKKSVDEKFRKALSQGKNCKIETRIVWPDQSVHWISLRGRVYLNNEGRTIQMAGLIVDVTAEKLARQEIQKAKLAAEDANREKSYFLANMSHEIRTPLGAILGFTEILKEPSLIRQDQLNYLQIISRNGIGLAKLIDDILDLSKVEAGFLEVENSLTKPVELLEEVTNLLRVKTDAKNLQLMVEVDEKMPAQVLSDPIRLRQILMNVVGNAIKFTDRGSVTATMKCSSMNLEIFIKDSGVGISKNAQAYLFQPFTQADSSTSRRFGGTGLGLALSRRLAIAMGGNLILQDSQPEKGSTFLITVPLIIPIPGVIASEPTQVPDMLPPIAVTRTTDETLSGLRILLAEDSLDNQVLIKRLLDKKGVELQLASDGQAAVDQALANNFDLILMDMQMPKLDGYEATRVLRKQGYTAPIVALTAHAMRHDRLKCIEAGCSEYLSKPIVPTQLYKLVAEMADRTHHH